jgi:hypothetical protein
MTMTFLEQKEKKRSKTDLIWQATIGVMFFFVML